MKSGSSETTAVDGAKVASPGMADRRRSRTAPPKTDADGSEEPTFEEALQRLETIVDRLEAGDLELETALADFEEGVALSRRCAGQLDDAQRRIEVLVREGEKWIVRPFESEDEDSNAAGEELS